MKDAIFITDFWFAMGIVTFFLGYCKVAGALDVSWLIVFAPIWVNILIKIAAEELADFIAKH